MTDLVLTTGNELKSCCAAVYETEWARLLLGDSFHPGGLELTERLGNLLCLGPNITVLDAACGRGDSALHLATTFGCRVVGVDFGAANVAQAKQESRRRGLDTLVEFRVGDVESLPFKDATVDAIVCECAFCTFPNKGHAATEFSRVLRPGGRVGISDLTRKGALHPELDSLLGWIACIADARTVEEYRTYLTDASFTAPSVENHNEALTKIVRDIQGRLLATELLIKLGKVHMPAIDLEQTKAVARLAAQEVRAGRLGYSLVIATK